MSTLTPPLLGPGAVVAITTVANLAIAGFAIRGRLAEAVDRQTLVPLGAVVALLCWAIGTHAVFGTADRYGPVWLGLALGLAQALLWGWAFPDRDTPDAGPLATGLLALGAIGMAYPDPVSVANGGLGLLAMWGTASLWAAKPSPAAAPLDLAACGLVAGAAAWGERLWPAAGHGLPLALALGTWFAASLALGGLVGKPESPRLGALVAGGLYALGALLIALAGYDTARPLLGLLALGAGLGVLAPALLSAPLMARWAPLALLVLGGGLLVVESRLAGIAGMAYGGLGIAVAARAWPQARPWLAAVLAVFAARVWLQLFLERTLLTGYGVDVTHAYSFAALVVGGLWPTMVDRLRRAWAGDMPLMIVWGLAVAAGPAWLGYYMHLEALGAFLAGLVVAVFVAAARPEGDADAGAADLAPALVITGVAASMLVAPWLVDVMNVTRESRLLALGVAAVAAVAVAGLAWARGHKPTPA